MTSTTLPTSQHAQAVARSAPSWRLLVALLLALTVLGLEIAGGFVTGSLALLSDATHVLVDIVALLIGLGAARMAARAPDAAHTYGFHRLEVIGALANGILLVTASGIIFIESIGRLFAPTDVDAPLVLVVASIGLIVNGVSAFIVHGSERSTSATKVLVLHLGGDALGAFAVIVSALFIMAGGSSIADPVASLVIAVVLALAGFRLLGHIVHLLVEGVAPGTSSDAVGAALQGTAGVTGVHDLHVWALAEDMPIVSAHLEIDSDATRTLAAATEALRQAGFEHATLQPEQRPCGQGRLATVEPDNGRTSTSTRTPKGTKP